ncbi:MAG: hypothetical protein NZM31_02990 [Gemmatales bacterium]|nr:hypothetical protein [Gemmatales bacterium]MDW8385966.1 hypothetical protein [Gemmatales bacterium]
MRRRRPQLSVSLFPFLSVLLCTLGSLIFLLLVLDQQARRQRDAELQQRQQAALTERLEQERRIAEQMAENSRRLEEIRAQVRRQEQMLSQERERLEERKHDAEHLLQATAEHLRHLEQRHAILRDRLRSAVQEQERLQKQTQELRADLQNHQRRRDGLRSDIALLEEQVAALEKMVARLQAATAQPPPPVYSLIPYRGRLGARRRPIYLECVGQQVHIRPNGPSLFLTDLLEPQRLEQEIRQQAAHLPPEQKPYVLLLVRPSGIPTYYLVLRELAKADVDLGYELIEEDWVLDFSEPSTEDLLAEEKRFSEQRSSQAQASRMKPRAAVGLDSPGRMVAGTERKSGGAAGSVGGGGNASASPGGRTSPEHTEVKKSRPVPVGGAAAEDKPIVIECRAQGVMFWPDKTTVSAADLATPVQPAGSHPFLDKLNALLDRRKRAGFESVPRLRVYVRPDGLRTYYRLAALLEPLAVRTEVETIRSDTNMEALLP